MTAKLCEGVRMSRHPEPRPEGNLIKDALKRSRLSARKAAEMAGMSEGRWRQIVNGYQTVSKGVDVEVIGPGDTVARMALVAGVTAEQLEDAGRTEAAEELRKLIQSREHAPPLPSPLDELEPWRQRTIIEMVSQLPPERRAPALHRLAERVAAGELPPAEPPEEPDRPQHPRRAG